MPMIINKDNELFETSVSDDVITESNSSELEAYYGLPHSVEFCASCVISNQRPNSAVEFEHTSKSKKSTINLDENGVCDACQTPFSSKWGTIGGVNQKMKNVTAIVEYNLRSDKLTELGVQARTFGNHPYRYQTNPLG